MIASGNNKLTVSANICLQKESWGSIDDFYLYKIEDLEEEEPTPTPHHREPLQ